MPRVKYRANSRKGDTMGLSDKESKLLERLLKKKDEPDAPRPSASLNISIDLGDESQVKRAQKLGLFAADDDDDDDNGDGDGDGGGDGDGDGDGEQTPRRRGFFREPS